MVGFLADTSLLRVYTSIQRLDLLSSWMPIHITPEILREHGEAPAHAIRHLTAAIQKGDVVLDVPTVDAAARKLTASDPRLSYADAVGVLHAEKNGYAVFVADDVYRRECQRRGIKTTGVASILLYHRRADTLTQAEVKPVAGAMVAAGYYRFSDEERTQLRV